MHFFLYEIVARIVAVYLGVDCSRILWRGFIERRIAYHNSDLIAWLLDPTTWVAHRDDAPVQYWLHMGSQMMALVGCLYVVIFGWFQPTT
jgi:hypothetical protein